jgi:beta-catenin-like protein 1
MELHFQYMERVQAADRSVNADDNNANDDDDDDDEVYLRKLDGGLFTLQLIDYIIVEIASSTASITSIRQRVMKILNLRNSSSETIKSILRGT